jgi:hypothetical protein
MGARLWLQDEARMSIHCLMEPASEVAIALKATSLVMEIITADFRKR